MIDLTNLLLDELCDECGHKIRLHADKYGCEYELGDRYTAGYAPMAMGPCSCKFWNAERIEQLKQQTAMDSLLAQFLEHEAKFEPGLEKQEDWV